MATFFVRPALVGFFSRHPEADLATVFDPSSGLFTMEVTSETVTFTGAAGSIWEGVQLVLRAATAFTTDAEGKVQGVIASGRMTIVGEEALVFGWDASRGEVGPSIANVLAEPAILLAGDDKIFGSSAPEWLFGGGGDDYIIGDRHDTLMGGEGNDYLHGGYSGDTYLYGGAGNDRLVGGVAHYGDAPTGVTVTLDDRVGAQDTIGAGIDTLESVYKLVGSAFGDVLSGGWNGDELVGGGGNDRLFGGEGDDLLTGGEGDDVLEGGAGTPGIGPDGPGVFDSWRDVLTGGAGVDRAAYTRAAGGVTVSLAISGPQATGHGMPHYRGGPGGLDTLIGIEDLEGSSFADELSGDAGGNMLLGGAGSDTLHGAGGDDRLYGDAGHDHLEGGAGDDLLFGGEGFDYARYQSAGRAVTVSLAVAGPQDTGGGGLDSLHGVEGLVGSAFDDRLTGDDASNDLNGGAGADLLLGGLGDDRLAGDGGHDHLFGGAGADLLEGGEGFDYARYDGAANGVTVSLVVAARQDTGGDGLDTLSGMEGLVGSAFADVLTGDQGANDIHGGGGNDRIFGAGGADVISGGLGDDLLSGGAGADRFMFLSVAESRVAHGDVVLDFSSADGDLIDLSGIDADVATAGDQGFAFVSAFTRQAGQVTLSYIADGDVTVLLADVNGDGVQDFELLIKGAVDPSAGGFVL